MNQGPNQNEIQITDNVNAALYISFERYVDNPEDLQVIAFIRGLLHEINGNQAMALQYYGHTEDEDNNHEDILEYAMERAETLKLEIQFEKDENEIKIEDAIITAIYKSFERLKKNPDDRQVLAFIRGLLHEKNGNQPRAILYYGRVEELNNSPGECHQDILSFAVKHAIILKEEMASIPSSGSNIVTNSMISASDNKEPDTYSSTPLSRKKSFGSLIEKNPDNDYAVARMLSLLHKSNGNNLYGDWVMQEFHIHSNSLVGSLWRAFGNKSFNIEDPLLNQDKQTLHAQVKSKVISSSL